MRKLLVSAMVAALVLTAVGPLAARADDAKDVKILAAVSIGGVDRVMADVGLMGELAGKEDIGKMAEGLLNLITQGKGLVGIDRERPWGILIGAADEEIGGCAFVPVTDLGKLMDLAKKLAKDKVKELDDGIYEIDGSTRNNVILDRAGDMTHNFSPFLDTRPGVSKANCTKRPSTALVRPPIPSCTAWPSTI